VAAFCKAQLRAAGRPDALVYLNECAISFQGERGRPWSWIHGDKLPAGLDLISLDAYELTNSTRLFDDAWWHAEPRENRALYKKFIYPMLRPHQRVLLVPGLYGNASTVLPRRTPDADLQDERLVLKLNEYWDWAKDDDRVIGLNPYHWADADLCTLDNQSLCVHMCYGGEGCDRPQVCGKSGDIFGAGARNFPRLVSRMREIGMIIRNNTKPSTTSERDSGI
jgi:hypothetical protein